MICYPMRISRKRISNQVILSFTLSIITIRELSLFRMTWYMWRYIWVRVSLWEPDGKKVLFRCSILTNSNPLSIMTLNTTSDQSIHGCQASSKAIAVSTSGLMTELMSGLAKNSRCLPILLLMMSRSSKRK
jgi:hypothetical protein